jgi:hypothetical protein
VCAHQDPAREATRPGGTAGGADLGDLVRGAAGAAGAARLGDDVPSHYQAYARPLRGLG